jgi:N-acetylmuramoyl-L-alanine amidase
MRHHRARFLHILAIAPVAAILAGVLGPTQHALAAASKVPAPIVVTVDPGFGGQPTPSNPNVPFDPGAIGVNGLLEKDVDLDVAARLAALLRADLVDVVMTRSTDIYVSAARREQISVAQHAALVVSIHANTSTNAHAEGFLVLYPAKKSAAFATTMSDALNAQLTTDGISDAGVALGDAAWLRNPVPVATVAMGYLSNPTDASLIATTAFRQDVASGMRDGVEAYMPAIIARRNAILAWREAHRGTVTPGSLEPASAAIPGTKGFQFEPVIAWLLAIVGVGLLLLFRDAVARVLVVLIALLVRLFGGVMWLRRAAIRRRRRRQRSRVSARPPSLSVEPRRRSGGSVYDDIPL